MKKFDVILWETGNFSVRRGDKHDHPWVTYKSKGTRVFGTFTDYDVADVMSWSPHTYIEASSA